MMVDMQTMPVFLPLGEQDIRRYHSASATTATQGGGWVFDNTDLSAFLSTPSPSSPIGSPMEFPIPSSSASSPIDTTDLYYATSSPETFVSPEGSPYHSDISQTPSPFDPALFNNSPMQPSDYQQQEYAPLTDVDPSLFDASNLTNPLLLPEIEKILNSTQFHPTSQFQETARDETSSKKRLREIDITGEVTLSRDQLLTMSSKEIEEYVSALKTKRTLTASEEKDLKKQRRLVKNREYASQSRTRKKQFVEDLEKQVEIARAETEGYRRQNQLLIEENNALKRQLGSIADAIKKSQHGGQRNMGMAPTAAPAGVFTKFTTIGGGRHNGMPSKTVSACLFAIFFMVFTFATFWDNEPLGITLFPNQNHGHKFSNRHLLEFEAEADLGIDSTLAQAYPPPTHKPSTSTNNKFTSHSAPTAQPPLSPSPADIGLCYPHTYDATTNVSAWCQHFTQGLAA